MENRTALNTTLPTHRVHVVEQGATASRHWVRCEIGENLKFDMGGLQSYCLANWDKRVHDAFVVAAAVQFCDHTKRRPRLSGHAILSCAFRFMILGTGTRQMSRFHCMTP